MEKKNQQSNESEAIDAAEDEIDDDDSVSVAESDMSSAGSDTPELEPQNLQNAFNEVGEGNSYSLPNEDIDTSVPQQVRVSKRKEQLMSLADIGERLKTKLDASHPLSYATAEERILPKVNTCDPSLELKESKTKKGKKYKRCKACTISSMGKQQCKNLAKIGEEYCSLHISRSETMMDTSDDDSVSIASSEEEEDDSNLRV